MELIEQHASAGGWQNVYRHNSQTLNCEMNFGVYLPPKAATEKLPVLYWLSGLTCTEQNFITKSGMQHYAARNNIIVVVVPDTSPRGEHVADADSYDLGQGAGFYLNATEHPWNTHYRMYDYILHELPDVVMGHLPVTSRKSISGHSMGGLGALVLSLRNPDEYVSVSAFSPIVSPPQVPWGQQAFTAYLGENKKTWEHYDPVSLILQGAKLPEIFIDQGLSDAFYEDQLRTKSLERVCNEMNINTSFRYHTGYDHSYYFISSFIGEHIAYHANRLRLSA
ncbi:TPA: S-formylglutathione hydrolase [Klebsiella oxytoca]|uniref:S-formylglutathione hydrolase n=1 Tax=Klebsiella pneumoniae complex TaxID=3390273 RepID=UPI00050C17F5|nr:MULTISPECIES: S-formylglutathione hydrolase [Klebsiella]HCI5657547.1 S-formylglutathione hydrolase [Klebsiella variicola subsp. variicola]HCI6377662.1 S-formylglutathione hydrolase [Klebsiella quasipneumoniae subsp. similipneumoniae]HDU4557789.1 S-formylglutathione hydrolase [Klebsiella pneumoniae subsp. pneumoniae]ELA2166185.1 S-formylglutathione hydrolase [Klebsiella pneumoniae]ELA2261651.1 S-formylglutathione hydrolase [Klebsiella pneumoniae]